VVTEIDLALGDGRTLHVYDTGASDGTTGLAVFWHHGAPSTGAPPEPLFAAAAERGIRWVSHDRPGYGSIHNSSVMALDWLREHGSQR
jgi:pimeloyl-ACP methyl ester carboxylesterase